MLSDPSVQTVASNFVAVKIDLRQTQEALQHKSTRYVPELVVLDAGQNRIATIEARDPASMQQALANALSEVTRRKNRR